MKQAKEKLETELLFLKDSWLKRPFSLRNDIQNRYSNDFAHKTKQKKIEKIIFPYGNKIYVPIQPSLNLKG